jgi:GxxExxY protein
MEVHSHLGPGLREKFYEQAMVLELRRMGLRVGRQVPFRVFYKGEDLGIQTVDTVVEECVHLEFKAVAKVTETDLAQLVGYLRFTDLPLGLLINFNVASLRKGGIFRRINWPPKERRINWPPKERSAAIVVESAPLSVSSVNPL